jgi:hypothetical protein
MSPRFLKHTRFRLLALAILLSGFVGLIHRPIEAHAAGDGIGSATDDAITAAVSFEKPPTTDPCSWRVVTSITATPGPSSGPITVRTRNGQQETLYARYCGTTLTYHWISDASSLQAAVKAKDRVSRLVPSLLARTAPDAGNMVVNVGTWFWVPRTIWKPFSVTAYIATSVGPIIVTTTAIPTNVIFSPGDGNNPVSCKGPGTPWSRRNGDSDKSSCMYTYRQASHTRPTGVYKSNMAIEWKISWKSNLGIGGPLPSIRTGLSSNVRVLEMQALSRSAS